MRYHSSIGVVQPPLDIHFGKPVSRRRSFGWPGGSALWLAGAKLGLVMFGLMLGLTLWLGHTASAMNSTIMEIESMRHQLKDEQITLLAERANLMSEKQVSKRAGEQLALYVPGEEQVFHLR